MGPLFRSPLERYSVYGITLATDFDLRKRLPPSSAQPDVTFECVSISPGADDWARSQRLYPAGEEDGPLSIHRFDDHLGVRFAGTSDFHVWDDRIVCELVGDYPYLVPNQLLGLVLALWLEQGGIHALHASAAVVVNEAVAFLSAKEGGKTSTAAALIAAGYPMLTEDLLAVEEMEGRFVARPGYPQMRMWPHDATRLGVTLDGLDVYHPSFSKRWVPIGPPGFGTFCNRSQPLACVYVLERTNDIDVAVEITPIRAAEAVMSLSAGSFLPDVVQKASRFDFLVRLAGEVPVRRLRYRGDGDRWTDVGGPVLHDLVGL